MSGFSRRHFLRGAGGFTLGLPFLPSLLPSEAAAQAARPRLKHFVAITSDHGGVWPRYMFPDPATAPTQTTYRTQPVKSGPLRLNVNNGVASLSPVLSGSSSRFTQAIADRMNVIQGLDIPFYISHHSGGYLGNLARNEGNGADGRVMQAYPTVTIDQHLAWSPSFYRDLSTIRERSLVIGQGISWGFSSPSTQSGTIVGLSPSYSSIRLFDRIFVPDADPRAGRVPVVDRVLESYRRLRDGNRRLSAQDRRRLDDHMDRIGELERRLTVRVSCGNIPRPTVDSLGIQRRQGYDFNPGLMSQAWGLWNDIVVAAFSCGTSRIATLAVHDTFSAYQGDWHQSIAHQAYAPDGAAQNQLRDAHQRTFEGVFLDLAAKLAAVQLDENTTLLDDSFLMWSQESGNVTHQSYSIPVITAGSAAGWFRTGQYVDFRATTGSRVPTNRQETADTRRYNGLLYQQYLATVLDAMGVPRTDYERNGQRGWARLYLGDEARANNIYSQAVIDGLGEPLPLLRA